MVDMQRAPAATYVATKEMPSNILVVHFGSPIGVPEANNKSCAELDVKEPHIIYCNLSRNRAVWACLSDAGVRMHDVSQAGIEPTARKLYTHRRLCVLRREVYVVFVYAGEGEVCAASKEAVIREAEAGIRETEAGILEAEAFLVHNAPKGQPAGRAPDV
jgi:hypothetical protein